MLQVAGDLVERFPDGVWLVELAPLTNPELVAEKTADVLGVRGLGALGSVSQGQGQCFLGIGHAEDAIKRRLP